MDDIKALIAVFILIGINKFPNYRGNNLQLLINSRSLENRFILPQRYFKNNDLEQIYLT